MLCASSAQLLTSGFRNSELTKENPSNSDWSMFLMTSWSGGVRTGGWRVKNRSKFSAFRPHYERGRKERVVGEDQTEPNRTEQDRTGPNRTGVGGRGPSLPCLRPPRGRPRDRKQNANKKCNTQCGSLMTLGSRPSVSVAHELPPGVLPGSQEPRGKGVRWRGLVACGMSPPPAPAPPRSQPSSSAVRDGTKMPGMFRVARDAEGRAACTAPGRRHH